MSDNMNIRKTKHGCVVVRMSYLHRQLHACAVERQRAPTGRTSTNRDSKRTALGLLPSDAAAFINH